MGHSIYLADDEKSIRELLHSFLASDGYTVRSFESGDALLEAFRQEPAELVILDIMMPGTDGLTVCRELRSVSDIPIILLTAKDSELDYVMGISQGSDDYLTKPFRPTILLMKVRALLRRVEMDRGKTAAAVDELRYGDLRYSATENAVFCGSTIVALTQTELRLLSYMMKQPEKAYSREELLSAVWGFDSEVETRVTDETLRRIRKKLTQSGSTVSVSTIWGFGYKLKGAERQQTFFQNASHELKTPLMAIQGYAEGIQAGVMDTGSAAEVILEESDRMTELVEELLDISKIDMGRQQLALSEMDIRELLYDSIRAVESAAAASGITIAPDFSEEPIMVKCDDTQMRRAVTNILTNGLRYARSELRLTCRADRRQVTIRIQDDGDGIAEADLPHIFDRFYMGRSGKSGIGLALTREIIHLHKGTIRARNGDTGAVFEISIPVSR